MLRSSCTPAHTSVVAARCELRPRAARSSALPANLVQRCDHAERLVPFGVDAAVVVVQPGRRVRGHIAAVPHPLHHERTRALPACACESTERCRSACAVRHGAGHPGGRTHQSGPCSKSTLCTVVTKRNLCAFLPIRFALRRSILFAFRSGPPRSTAEHDPGVAVGELRQGRTFA